MFNRKAREIRALRAENRALKAVSDTDMLTGLWNKGAMDAALRREIGISLRSGSDLSVLFIDVNRMHDLNVAHGYEKVDEFLREIAAVISGTVRETDLCFRRSGDEFVVILPGTGPDNGFRAMDAINAQMKANDLLSRHGISVTIGSAKLSRMATGGFFDHALIKDLSEGLLAAASEDMISKKGYADPAERASGAADRRNPPVLTFGERGFTFSGKVGDLPDLVNAITSVGNQKKLAELTDKDRLEMLTNLIISSMRGKR